MSDQVLMRELIPGYESEQQALEKEIAQSPRLHALYKKEVEYGGVLRLRLTKMQERLDEVITENLHLKEVK